MLKEIDVFASASAQETHVGSAWSVEPSTSHSPDFTLTFNVNRVERVVTSSGTSGNIWRFYVSSGFDYITAGGHGIVSIADTTQTVLLSKGQHETVDLKNQTLYVISKHPGSENYILMGMYHDALPNPTAFFTNTWIGRDQMTLKVVTQSDLAVVADGSVDITFRQVLTANIDHNWAMVVNHETPWIMASHQNDDLGLEVGDIVRFGADGPESNSHIVREKRSVVYIANGIGGDERAGPVLSWGGQTLDPLPLGTREITQAQYDEATARIAAHNDAGTTPTAADTALVAAGVTARNGSYSFQTTTFAPYYVPVTNLGVTYYTPHPHPRPAVGAYIYRLNHSMNLTKVHNKRLETLGQRAHGVDVLTVRHLLKTIDGRKRNLEPVFKQATIPRTLTVPLDTTVKCVHSIKLCAYSMVHPTMINGDHEVTHKDWVALRIKGVNGEVYSNEQHAHGAFAILHCNHAAHDGIKEVYERDPAGVASVKFERPLDTLKRLEITLEDADARAPTASRIHLWFKLCVTQG